MKTDRTVAGPTLNPGNISIKRLVIVVCNTESPRCSYLVWSNEPRAYMSEPLWDLHSLFVVRTQIIGQIFKNMGGSRKKAAMGENLLIDSRRIDSGQRRDETVVFPEIWTE